jgi:RimJ/RimL family protein N-acetyltransferase
MVPYDAAMEIRDDELVLRPIESRDAGAIAAGLNDADAVRFLPSIPSPYTRADAEAWVQRCAEAWREAESYPFAIVDGASGELLGSIELHRVPATVGYWVAAAARRRGIATRALRLVCEWWSDRPLRLTTHPENLASQRVAEKAGFRRIGTTTDHPVFRDGTSEAILFELS